MPDNRDSDAMRGAQPSFDTHIDSINEGSSNVSRAKRKKTEKGRRVWTAKEEEVLMLSMKHVVAEGWKSDNGFRGGYLKIAEEHFKKHLPKTDLKSDPHMNSKLGAWKKNYYSLCTILNHSEVGFNSDGMFTVECEDAVWDELEKVDRNAKAIREKSWPLYEGWKEIFGKDRATGDLAEDVIDAVNELEREYAAFDDTYTPGDYRVSLDDIGIPDTAEQSVCQTQGSTQLPKPNESHLPGTCSTISPCSLHADQPASTPFFLPRRNKSEPVAISSKSYPLACPKIIA